MLNYRKFGSGKPLIILHGVFGSSDNWQTLGKKFAKQFEVFLVDQRNHGNSFHHDEFNYEVMSADLLELIKHEGLNNIHLLGHSMGGKTAMKFVAMHPQIVNKLVVVDIAPKIYEPHHQNIFKAFHSVDLKNLNSRNEADQQMSQVIDHAGVKQFLLKNLKRDAAGFRWKVNLAAIESQIEEVGKGLADGEGFTKETLFIAGGNSDYIKSSDNDKIKHHFPNSKVITIANAGHWVHAEKPRELYQEVISFLTQEP